MWSFQKGSKTTKKRWRHHFPHYKSMGAFCCHGNQSFDSICPKTLCSLSPTPMMLHIKFDQDWPIGFKDIQVQKCGIFVTQRQVTPKWVVWFGPKSNSTELLCLSCYQQLHSQWSNLLPANSIVSGPIWLKFELVWDFMHALVTCKYKRDRIKSNREKVETQFSPVLVNGGFLLPWTPELWSNLQLKHYAAFPHPQWCYI